MIVIAAELVIGCGLRRIGRCRLSDMINEQKPAQDRCVSEIEVIQLVITTGAHRPTRPFRRSQGTELSRQVLLRSST